MRLYIPRHTYGDEPLHTHSLLGLQKRLTALGIEHSFASPFFDSHVNRGRNRVAHNFIKTDFDGMLSLDADIVFKPWDVERLLSSGYDFVGAAYPMKVIPTVHIVGNILPDGERDNAGFIEAKDIGGGFAYISRRVFEKLILHAPIAESNLAGGTSEEYSIFYDSGVDGREYMTEDWWISRAYRAVGGRLWLDGDARIGHVGKHVYVATSTVNETLAYHEAAARKAEEDVHGR